MRQVVSFEIGTELREFKKKLYSDNLKAIHIYSETDPEDETKNYIVFWLSTEEYYKGKTVDFNFYRKFETNSTHVEPFRLFFFSTDCQNIQTLFRLVKNGKDKKDNNKITLDIYFNNSCTMYEELGLIQESLFMKYGRVKLRHDNVTKPTVGNFKKQQVNMDYWQAIEV